ncbi:MAG: patatin-like phospholipase family protein [Planctomycetota bacterium]
MQQTSFARRLRSLALQAGLLGAALVGGACQAPQRHAETPEQHAQRLQREQAACRDFFDRLTVRVGRRLEKRVAERGTLDVLVLSGGGDFGAFGAGFLQGWGQVSDPTMRRPQFDAVFGTSTGALLAPLAFVGTEDALKVGTDLYSDPPSDLVESNGLIPILPWNESLAKPTGLRRTLEQQLSADMLKQLRDAMAQDRVLACAATNADFGTFRPLNLLEHAGEDDTAFRQSIVERLLASSAIPAVFPPIEMDGSLFVDGGATANIWAVRDQSQPNSVLQRWLRAHKGSTPPKMRIWVIVNNQLFPRNGDAKREWIDLAGRGVSIMLRSTMLKDLRLTAYAALQVDEKLPGEMEFRFIAIPDEWVPPVKGNFQKPTMRALVDLGRKLGADSASWRTLIPNIDDVGGFDAGQALEPTGRGGENK